MSGYNTPLNEGYKWMRSPVPGNYSERLANTNSASTTDVLAGVTEMIVGKCIVVPPLIMRFFY
jgi:hypothetical protein